MNTAERRQHLQKFLRHKPDAKKFVTATLMFCSLLDARAEHQMEPFTDEMAGKAARLIAEMLFDIKGLQGEAVSEMLTAAKRLRLVEFNEQRPVGDTEGNLPNVP